MEAVHIRHHVRPETDKVEESVKLIGVYRTRSSAEAAIARLQHQPGFRDYPDDFHCEPYQLDESQWTEGFVQGD